jgi:UrcA family protein
MKIITAFAAVVAIIASSINVSAAVAGEASVVTTAVSYAGLDLGSAAGQQMLEKRIRLAARQACGVNPDVRHLALTVDAVRCYRSAVAGAMAEAAKINPTVYASR